MARVDDAERLKYLGERIAALRSELAELRTERDAVMARLRTLPSAAGSTGRFAVKVDYGANGEGLLLVDLPAKGAAVTRPATADAGKSAGDPDVKDR